MSTNANIQSQLGTVQQVFEAAHAAISGMQDGERMQIKELAQVVALAVAAEPKYVLGFVNHFAHNTDIAYVTRGKNGGIVKGVRPVKVVKVKKPKKVVDPALTASPVDTAMMVDANTDATSDSVAA